MPEFRGKNITNERLLAKSTMSRWKSVSLYRTQIDDDGISRLCETATRLEEVHIQSDRISDLSMPALCALPCLKSLLLDGVPQITDLGIASVAKVSQLRELYLKGTQLSDAGIDALLELSQVWSLSLAGTKITDAGVSKLLTLRRLAIVHLEEVKLHGWGLHALPNTDRMYLYLNGCPIRDDALIPFVTSNDRVAILSLNESTVGDTAMSAIASLPGLTDLRLESTMVTDNGVKYLVGHPSLSMLYLERTGVSIEMIHQLKSRSPNDLIVYC